MKFKFLFFVFLFALISISAIEAANQICCKLDNTCFETTNLERCNSLNTRGFHEGPCNSSDLCYNAYPCYVGDVRNCSSMINGSSCNGVSVCSNHRWGVCRTNCTDFDKDGDPDTTDCDLNNPAVYNGADEIVNSIDDNCDGIVDRVMVSAAPPREAAVGALIITVVLVVLLLVVYKITRVFRKKKR